VFPWNEWALTGVAQGPAGAEAWLLHKPSGQTRVLAVGQTLDAAALSGVQIDAQGDAAEFTLGKQRFRVAVGATMDQRTPNGQ
jgi:acyl CoA:acetate/3-ketoacid CoA transferase beta subunit